MPGQTKGLDRRTLLQLVSSGILATTVADAQTHCGGPAETSGTPPVYRFQFFTPEETQLLEKVMEKIIPHDEHSPGATEARVIEFADLMVATGSDETKDDWRTGCRLLAAELQNTALDKWMDMAAQQEDNPQTVLEIFFRSLKQMTINGYYSSSVGIHKELHYQGNTYLTAFAGCEHPEHRTGGSEKSG